MKINNVFFVHKLSSLRDTWDKKKSFFIICDRKLKPFLKIKKNIYFVSGGEKLKNLNEFHLHAQKILKKISTPPNFFIGIGGGSVTDFTGFFSHIYKRGREVWYIPSTLLAAMDSSHGGKTAMDINSVKNVFGSYHFPERVYIVKELLENLDSREILSAGGELVKIALIEGGSFYSKLKKTPQTSFKVLWKFLPEAIRSKLKYVKKDPFEKNGIRKKLNFGHTLGHGFESYFKYPHGKAVAMGILFSLEWSLSQKFLSQKDFEEIQKVIYTFTGVQSFPKSIPSSHLKKLLLEDKKLKNLDQINFVFIRKPGDVFLKPVSIDHIIQFYSSL